MSKQVHHFCAFQCASYPQCSCYKAARNAISNAADQAGKENMKNWSVNYDDDKGVINIKNLRIDEEMREQ